MIGKVEKRHRCPILTKNNNFGYLLSMNRATEHKKKKIEYVSWAYFEITSDVSHKK